MALTESKMLDLGTQAPEFNLPDTVSGDLKSYSDIKGEQGTVVLFLCNHCPYVIHVNEELVKIANEYLKKGIGFVAISSNDVVNYPEDAPDKMKLIAKVLRYVFDGHNHLYYRGRLDESRPGNEKPLNGKDLRLALDLLLRGEPPLQKQYPGAGCNIKWKK